MAITIVLRVLYPHMLACSFVLFRNVCYLIQKWQHFTQVTSLEVSFIAGVCYVFVDVAQFMTIKWKLKM
jgi:hypothetical protein